MSKVPFENFETPDMFIQEFARRCDLLQYLEHVESGYTGGFVAHYIFAAIYPAGLTRGIEIAIGVVVLVVNVSVYVRVFR